MYLFRILASSFFYIRTCFIYQAALVVIYMVLYWSTFSLMFLIHFLYAVCLLYRSQNQLVDEYFYRHAAVFTVIVETAICSLNRSLTLQGDISHCIYFQAKTTNCLLCFSTIVCNILVSPAAVFWMSCNARPPPFWGSVA